MRIYRSRHRHRAYVYICTYGMCVDTPRKRHTSRAINIFLFMKNLSASVVAVVDKGTGEKINKIK